MRNFPKQRLSYSEKVANDFKWVRDSMDSLMLFHSSQMESSEKGKSEYQKKLSSYQLYNNQLNQTDFEEECNPLGIEVGQFKDSIQPYNKTYNKVQVLLGEELRRPFKYKSVLVNSEGIRSKLAYRDHLLHSYVSEFAQKNVQVALGQIKDEEAQAALQKLMDPQTINRYMNTTYLESREILAAKILAYLTKKLSLKDLKNDAFKHALISGEEIVYVGELDNEPHLEIVNPLGFFYHKSPEVKYIQDSLYAGYQTYMTTGDVLDKYGQYLSEKDLNRIDQGKEGFMGINSDLIGPTMKYGHDQDNFLFDQFLYANQEGSYTSSSISNDWLVQHVEWVSQKKVGFLSFINSYGDQEEDIVSEDFEVPATATKETITKEWGKKCEYYIWSDATGTQFSLEWGWIPEVWTGTRIGQDIYCMMGPKQNQFRSLDNPFHVKLGYHGLVLNSMNAPSTSLMDRMKPFQYLYFIVMHKLKKLIAQDKGKIFHFDISMVDPKIGLEKTMYYLTDLNIDIYNPLQNAQAPGWSQRGKVSNSTDMSTSQHIANYVSILAMIDQQISDVAGVTRQREGQAMANESVTNAQSNIQMSSVITEVYFQAHNKLWEEVLTSLVQTAQNTYKGKSMIKQFILDDMGIQTLELTPDSLLNADFGVFISDAARDHEVFEQLKSLAQALIQNDKATFSDLIRTLKADSTEELESFIKQSEEQAQQRQMQLQQQQIEAQQAMQQAEQEFQFEFQQRELDTKVHIAEIQSFARQMDQDIDDNGVPDQLEIEKLRIETALKARDLALKERKQASDERFKAKDQDIKEKELVIKRKAANRKPSS